MHPPACPDCREPMTAGFVIDHTEGGWRAREQWVEGIPEKSFWASGLKTKNRTVLPVSAFRCPRCGLLRHYANPEPA